MPIEVRAVAYPWWACHGFGGMSISDTAVTVRTGSRQFWRTYEFALDGEHYITMGCRVVELPGDTRGEKECWEKPSVQSHPGRSRS